MRSKWIVFAIIAIIMILFARTVETPSLNKSAIVLGIGVDYFEEEEEFEVSTQSVLVGSSSGENTSTTYDTYSAKGKTIAEAMDRISRKMGLIVSLAHCNVIVMSQSTLKLDHMQLIYPLTGMYALPEQAIIVTGNKSPKEMLSLRIGTTMSAPFFLQLALTNEEGSDGMIRTTAKDFLARSLSRSEANAIPYLVAKKLETPPIGAATDGDDSYEFEISRALVFNHEKCLVVEGELAEALALYQSQNVVGTLNYTSDDGGSIEFKVLKKEVDLSASDKKITVNIRIAADLSDVQHIETDKVLTGADDIVKEYASMLAYQLQGLLMELYDISKQSGIDFLNLQSKAYQSVGRKLKENCLDELDFSPHVKLSVEEAG